MRWDDETREEPGSPRCQECGARLAPGARSRWCEACAVVPEMVECGGIWVRAQGTIVGPWPETPEGKRSAEDFARVNRGETFTREAIKRRMAR